MIVTCRRCGSPHEPSPEAPRAGADRLDGSDDGERDEPGERSTSAHGRDPKPDDVDRNTYMGEKRSPGSSRSPAGGDDPHSWQQADAGFDAPITDEEDDPWRD
jgi:hypothetical protein